MFQYKTVIPEPLPTKPTKPREDWPGNKNLKHNGRVPGAINKLTRTRRQAEQDMRIWIMARLDELLLSAFQLSKGLKFVFRIDVIEEGKKTRREHTLVTDPMEIKAFLDEHEGGDGTVDDVYYYISTKSPDVRAIEMLMDRLFGKARQNIGIGGEEENTPAMINVSTLTPQEANAILMAKMNGEYLPTSSSKGEGSEHPLQAGSVAEGGERSDLPSSPTQTV